MVDDEQAWQLNMFEKKYYNLVCYNCCDDEQAWQLNMFEKEYHQIEV